MFKNVPEVGSFSRTVVVSVNYDGMRNYRANDRKCVTNEILQFQSFIYDIPMTRKIFWMSEYDPN